MSFLKGSPQYFRVAISRVTAWVEDFRVGRAIRSLSPKSQTDLIFGLVVLSQLGALTTASTALMSPAVFSCRVTRVGGPATPNWIWPDCSASLTTDDWPRLR